MLIADIVGSKRITNRSEIQDRLNNQLNAINRRAPGLVSPYTITLGDEFQAVYQQCDHLIEDIFQILTSLYPVRIRFAIGWGTINTQINRESSLGMDGPAFHLARDGIQMLKKIDYSIIQFYGSQIHRDSLLNRSVKLAMVMLSHWKKNTWIILAELMKKRKVREIAPLLSISERGVYKAIKNNHLKECAAFWTAVQKDLERDFHR